MKTKLLNFATLVLLQAAMFGISSCSSIQAERSTSVEKTATSTTVVDTIKVAGTVTAIDPSTRKVKLTLSGGERTTVKCGPEVRNFDQIHLHDRVNLTVTERVAAYLDKGKATGSSVGTTVALAPLGAKPGVVVADTVRATVKITAIDAPKRKVTFQNKDGKSTTIKVGEHIDLAKVKVGDSVTFRVTEAVAISVEKP